MIFLYFSHSFPVLVFLENFLLLKVEVALLQILYVFVLLPTRALLLLAIALLILMELCLDTTLASIQLSLELLLLLKPLLHLSFFDEHNTSELRAHNGLLLRVATLIVELVDLVLLLLGHLAQASHIIAALSG